MNINEWKFRNTKENEFDDNFKNTNIKHTKLISNKCFECGNSDRKNMFYLRYCLHLLCKNCLSNNTNTSNSATKILKCPCNIEYDTSSADISGKHYYEKLYEYDAIYRKFINDNCCKLQKDFNTNNEYNDYLRFNENSIMELQINKENINNLYNNSAFKSSIIKKNNINNIDIDANKIHKNNQIYHLHSFEKFKNIDLITNNNADNVNNNNNNDKDILDNNITNIKHNFLVLLQSDAYFDKRKKDCLSKLLNKINSKLNTNRFDNSDRLNEVNNLKNVPKYVNVLHSKKNDKLLERRAGGVTISYSYTNKYCTFIDGLI